MKEVADRAEYDEYQEGNDMKATIRDLEMIYGY